jgi:hypothetical protein
VREDQSKRADAAQLVPAVSVRPGIAGVPWGDNEENFADRPLKTLPRWACRGPTSTSRSLTGRGNQARPPPLASISRCERAGSWGQLPSRLQEAVDAGARGRWENAGSATQKFEFSLPSQRGVLLPLALDERFSAEAHVRVAATLRRDAQRPSPRPDERCPRNA